MKILIAPDSFKDCLECPEVAQALHVGIQRVHVLMRNCQDASHGRRRGGYR